MHQAGAFEKYADVLREMQQVLEGMARAFAAFRADHLKMIQLCQAKAHPNLGDLPSRVVASHAEYARLNARQCELQGEISATIDQALNARGIEILRN